MFLTYQRKNEEVPTLQQGCLPCPIALGLS
jgi:hypothetical protein